MEPSKAFLLLRYVISVFMWTLVGRGALWLLIVGSGSDPKQNKVYQVFTWMLWPVLRPLRLLLPKAIPDAYVGWIALPLLWFLLIGCLWLFLHLGWIGTR
jgi:hypothetical protein